MEQKNSSALIIFIKNPRLGKVKTRLARTVGDKKALQIYRALLGHTRLVSLSLEMDRNLYYSHFIDHNDDWSDDDFVKQLQLGNDLGARMSNAFQETLKQYDKAIIIGSDCASLSPELIKNAFKLLDDNDFVIGPALDGGYYLLGMTQLHLEIFQDIEWSTASVFDTTIQKIEALNKTYALLPKLSDIDTEADWIKYGWKLAHLFITINTLFLAIKTQLLFMG